GNRLVGRACAVRGDDLDPRTLDILGHTLGIAANIDVRTLGDPGPELAAELAHAVLDIKLLAAIARPREGEPRQRPGSLHPAKLVFVEEIVIAVLVTEEQPVMPGCLPRHALVKESAERRDARAGTDHDNRHGRIARKAELLRLLDINLDLVARVRALGKKG